MPVEVEPGWVGRRVSVRRLLAMRDNGRPVFGDVVGDLVDLRADAMVIEDRHGLVEVPLETVAIAKVVPPSTAEELALEAVAARGWRPAHTEHLGGWLLRADRGFTGRANSVLPLKPPGLPLDDAIAQARAWYAERGLPLRFAIPTESRRLLDAELGERGWPFSPDVLVMTARLDGVVAADANDAAAVEVAGEPDDAWLRRYRDGTPPPDVTRALLTRHDTIAFAAVRDGADTVAIGRGVVDEEWLGISAVEVAPHRRRSGLGRAVVAALWQWGREQGAARSYLQASSDAPTAVAFWEALGYREHHAYRMRTDPAT